MECYVVYYIDMTHMRWDIQYIGTNGAANIVTVRITTVLYRSITKQSILNLPYG